MRKTVNALLAAAFCALAAANVFATSLCDVMADPGAFDHQTLDLTAFVSHGFEDFTLFDPVCPEGPTPIWVEYGGTFASGTIYCCGVGDERSRKEPLVVDGITTTIVHDRELERFDGLVQQEPDSVVHATLRGRFFAASKPDGQHAALFTGYGHFGMCSLFVIEQVLAVDPWKLRGVDYRSSPDFPELSEAGCFSKPVSSTAYSDAIAQQRAAESGARAWAFGDPALVAAESLAPAVKSRAGLLLTVARRASGRIVFEGTLPGKQNKYHVVVFETVLAHLLRGETKPHRLDRSGSERIRVQAGPGVALRLCCRSWWNRCRPSCCRSTAACAIHAAAIRSEVAGVGKGTSTYPNDAANSIARCTSRSLLARPAEARTAPTAVPAQAEKRSGVKPGPSCSRQFVIPRGSRAKAASERAGVAKAAAAQRDAGLAGARLDVRRTGTGWPSRSQTLKAIAQPRSVMPSGPYTRTSGAPLS